MNIAIIDNYHFETTYTLLSLFDAKQNHVTVFVHPEGYRQLKYLLREKENRFLFIIKKEGETNRRFIRQIFDHLSNNNFGLLYFNSIENNFILYAWHLQRLKKVNVVLTVHDINGFFQYGPSLSIRRLIRYIGKRRLLKIVPAINVLSENLASYLQSKLSSPKKIFNIPGSFFSSPDLRKVSYTLGNLINITIPGSVDTRRRNYELVLDFLQFARQQKIEVNVTLLGGFTIGYSEHIKQQCLDYLQSNKNLTIYHSSIVDQPEFDRVLAESHFIWMPLYRYTSIADGVTEQYGRSTCSGNIGDVIRHAKPFFSPAYMAIDPALEKCSIKYAEVSEMADVLKHLTPDKYESLQSDAHQACLHYTKENIIKRNTALFNEPITLASTP